PSSGAQFESLEKILLRAADGKVSDADRERLNQALRGDPQARRFVVRQIQNDVLIESELKTSQIARWFEDDAILSYPDASVPDRKPWPRTLMALRVAAAVLLITGAFLAGSELTRPDTEVAKVS